MTDALCGVATVIAWTGAFCLALLAVGALVGRRLRAVSPPDPSG